VALAAFPVLQEQADNLAFQVSLGGVVSAVSLVPLVSPEQVELVANRVNLAPAENLAIAVTPVGVETVATVVTLA
jgi:hypothetical protein